MEYRCFYETSDDFDSIMMSSDGIYLTGLWFVNSSDSLKHGDVYEFADLDIFKETSRWLDIYFSGSIPDFISPYKLDTTFFRQKVIDIMNNIKYGEVITYGDIASEIAFSRNINKMSSQAVGGAVGANPICIIIPCHRVVGKNHRLVGYGGDLKNKIALLRLEGIDISKYKE